MACDNRHYRLLKEVLRWALTSLCGLPFPEAILMSLSSVHSSVTSNKGFPFFFSFSRKSAFRLEMTSRKVDEGEEKMEEREEPGSHPSTRWTQLSDDFLPFAAGS